MTVIFSIDWILLRLKINVFEMSNMILFESVAVPLMFLI